MAHWLYNSAGNPIAFVTSEDVFSAAGRFIGRLEDNELWNGTYIGEIVSGDLLLRRIDHLAANRMMPPIPMCPTQPMRPMSRMAQPKPTSFDDVTI